MHDSRRVDAYLRIKHLPYQLRPAHVVREDGTTLVTVDQTATCGEVARWAPDHLSVNEQNAYRRAYGQPPVGHPLEEEWMSDDEFPSFVPADLQVPLWCLIQRSA